MGLYEVVFKVVLSMVYSSICCRSSDLGRDVNPASPPLTGISVVPRAVNVLRLAHRNLSTGRQRGNAVRVLRCARTAKQSCVAWKYGTYL